MARPQDTGDGGQISTPKGPEEPMVYKREAEVPGLLQHQLLLTVNPFKSNNNISTTLSAKVLDVGILIPCFWVSYSFCLSRRQVTPKRHLGVSAGS
jgi:hypothetical protein